jgi:hypothetical protein
MGCLMDHFMHGTPRHHAARPRVWPLAALLALVLACVVAQAKAQRTLTVAALPAVDTEWGARMIGSAIATTPLRVLFVLASRQLICGLATGAVKWALQPATR